MRFESDPEDYYRGQEKELDYYRALLVSTSNHPVLALISTLPTPMFLDLDRRASTPDEASIRYAIRRRRERNIFSVSLGASIAAAVALVESRYQRLQNQLKKISDRYRRLLVLNLISVAQRDYGPIEVPRRSDLQTIVELRKAAAKIPELLEVKESDIESRLTPFLTLMEGWAKQIPKGKELSDIMDPTRPSDPAFGALVQWSSNLPQLQKISEMIDIVERHNAEGADASSVMNKYIASVNRFLKDSNKELFFDGAGNLNFRVEDVPGARSISSLSSGEAQIFVLLTHLYFNPLAQQANVFIIDEPELSLHIEWQELFVESVLEANPSVQFIMATHSPSIILNRLFACRDMKEAGKVELR